MRAPFNKGIDTIGGSSGISVPGKIAYGRSFQLISRYLAFPELGNFSNVGLRIAPAN